MALCGCNETPSALAIRDWFDSVSLGARLWYHKEVAMRNILLLMLLAAVSRTAAAEWLKVTDGYRLVAYADPATIRRSGNLTRMWHLLDFKDVQGDMAGTRYWSLKAEFEYDCEGERSRLHF